MTKDEPKVYNTNAQIYTGIATGSSIVSLQDSKLDLFGTRIAYDNLINIIKSRSTIEEVGLRLLASHLVLDNYQNDIIQLGSYRKNMAAIPAEVKDLVVKNDYNKTLQNLKEFKDKDYFNFLYELLNYNHPHYSTKRILSNIRVSRVQSSDLIEIRFKSDDPGICQHTLNILIDVFIEEYSGIKVNQSDAVVKYFLGQLDIANERLNQAENELLEFNRYNNIINYYEQTKHIASEKEHFDLAFQEIVMENAAAKSAIEIIERKMSSGEKNKINNSVITELRDQLAKVNLAITMKSNMQLLNSENEQLLIEEISSLQNQAYNIQEMLKSAVADKYQMENTKEGIPNESIIQDWLTNVLLFEATKAQMVIGRERQEEFKKLFEDYAPLGATMKRLERKIEVAEREYLSLLESLSMAKLKQQNIELNSNIKVVAEPFYPIVAEASKRKFLLVIAFLIGIVIPAFAIIVLEFLDQNIKNVFRAENFIGLNVTGLFPILAKNKSVDFEYVKDRGMDIMTRRLILNNETTATRNKPDINLFFSILEGEGKSLIVSNLIENLNKVGYETLLLKPNTEEDEKDENILRYKLNNSFHKAGTIYDLDAEWSSIDVDKYDYIFFEMPGILKNTYPIKLFKSSHHSFLVTRSNRAWSKSDKNALKDILEFTEDKKPQIILNGVDLDEMESVLGDIPKRRTLVRKIIKNILRLQFFSRSTMQKSVKGIKLLSAIKKNKLRIIPLGVLALIIAFVGWKFVIPKINTPTIKEQKDKATAPISIQEQYDQVKEFSGRTESDQSFEKKIEKELIQDKLTLKYYVIGATFRSKENAEKCYTQYLEFGYSPKIIEQSGEVYKVAIGEYGSKMKAENVRTEFLELIPHADAWIFVSPD